LRVYSILKQEKLDTPIWNERTNQFYKKFGYTEIGRDNESVYYEKQMYKGALDYGGQV